jgi:uncharacterized membrane protein (UPF0127 family)
MRKQFSYQLAALFVTVIFVCFPRLEAIAAKDSKTEVKIAYANKKIRLGKKTILVELADDEEHRAHGLMFRQSLPEDHGMLFVFDSERPLGFWMKNTLIPLAIAFIDQDKRLIDIQEMVPAVAGEASPRVYNSAAPAMYALEMPKGWFARNKIEKGATFSFAR